MNLEIPPCLIVLISKDVLTAGQENTVLMFACHINHKIKTENILEFSFLSMPILKVMIYLQFKVKLWPEVQSVVPCNLLLISINILEEFTKKKLILMDLTILSNFQDGVKLQKEKNIGSEETHGELTGVNSDSLEFQEIQNIT